MQFLAACCCPGPNPAVAEMEWVKDSCAVFTVTALASKRIMRDVEVEIATAPETTSS